VLRFVFPFPCAIRNPHNPGQRLRVKVPKDCFGGTFKVTVPVKQPPPDADKDGVDHNKFSRIFQETLDDYARSFEDWCEAQSRADKKFAIHKEKQHKFDRVLKEFPTQLVTAVDDNYMKKIVRRARQNRHKRSKTAAAKKTTDDGDGDGDDVDVDDMDDVKSTAKNSGSNSKGKDDEAVSDQEQGEEEEEQEVEEQEEEEEEPKPRGRTVEIPTKGIDFPSFEWDIQDFAM
jgi:hypothetical protein